MAGKLYGVGVGPGDPQLITLKAMKIIEACEYIGIPAREPACCLAWRVAKGAVAKLEDKPVIAASIPMTTDQEALEAAYRAGSMAVISVLAEGKSIAFLNLGDPTVYGTYMELHKRVKEQGYEAEIVSGVPSFCAVAAQLGIALGERREQIHILPAYYLQEELTALQGTVVLMKSAGKLSFVKEELLELEAAGGHKAYAVANCGLPDQTVCGNINELDGQSGYFTTIIVKEAKNET